MTHYSANPIVLDLHPAYMLTILLVTVAIAACGIIFFMPISLLIKLFALILVLVYTLFFIAQDALLLLPWSYCRLEINAQDELLITRKDGVTMPVDLLPNSFVAAYLTVLNVNICGSRWRRSLILTPDRLDAQAFRQLRVWLRWRPLEPSLKSGVK